MQTVLSQLTSLPGVVGSLVCDLDGQLVARVFPPVFDVTDLQDAARTLADGATALDLSGETAELLDFRFKEGRLLVKPFTGSMLVVFCTKATNVQFLILLVAAAVAKLDKLRHAPPPGPAVPATATSPAATPATRPALALPAPTSPVTPAASAPDAEMDDGGDRRLKKRVAAPTKGLDELRRRLAEAAAGPRPGGAGTEVPAVKSPAAPAAAPAEGESKARKDETRAPGVPGMNRRKKDVVTGR